ncbi:uncharacterized protein CBL_11497 [Carabus blaptoides fortunei]
MEHTNFVLTVACICFLIADIQAYQSDSSRGRSRQLTGAQRTRSNVQPNQDNFATRYGRFLSLFTLVKFPNEGCRTPTGDNGTCLTAAECQGRTGTASGPCANGYGICCVFIATCGETAKENQTYFVNTGYPSQYDSPGSCQLTLLKSKLDICQFRLDFDQFALMGPEAVNNICNNDQFIVSGGTPVPIICGLNSGNHMYIDAGVGMTNPIILTAVTTGPGFPRSWKIRVSQIPCYTSYKAEDGCLQYFTGVSGQVQSYNYDPTTGLQLSNQDYSICIRMERNFCGIQYTQCPDTVNNRSQSFTLSGNSALAVQAMVGSQGANSCPSDYIIIPCASNVGRAVNAVPACQDRLCGGTFGAEVSLNPATVQSTVKPFRINFHTDNVEAPTDIGNKGFCLNYVQQPCTTMIT